MYSPLCFLAVWAVIHWEVLIRMLFFFLICLFLVLGIGPRAFKCCISELHLQPSPPPSGFSTFVYMKSFRGGLTFLSAGYTLTTVGILHHLVICSL
jgi:hypothetical protein